MKKTLAYKSKNEIIATIIILFLSIVLVFAFLMNYHFEYALLPNVIKIFVVVFIIIAIVSLLQLIMLLQNPKIIMEHDDENVYYYRGKNHKVVVPFNAMQNIIIRTSIWTKPFVVYTAIVIETKDGTIYFRHISMMNEVKDYIQNIAYHEGSR